jgi:hypothetical protein
MRLWSIHPKYLDRVGLVALWRESLLAQKVLRGKTKAYRNHSQLIRFKKHRHPERAIASYQIEVWRESKRRGFNFDKSKIRAETSRVKIPVTRGQLRYEFDLLGDKLKRRDPDRYQKLLSFRKIEFNAVFRVVDGAIEKWERKKLNIG